MQGLGVLLGTASAQSSGDSLCPEQLAQHWELTHSHASFQGEILTSTSEGQHGCAPTELKSPSLVQSRTCTQPKSFPTWLPFSSPDLCAAGQAQLVLPLVQVISWAVSLESSGSKVQVWEQSMHSVSLVEDLTTSLAPSPLWSREWEPLCPHPSLFCLPRPCQGHFYSRLILMPSPPSVRDYLPC